MNWVLWVALAVIAFGASYVFLYAIKRVQKSLLRARCREKKALVLTYDDGPGIRMTPKLLGLLKEHGAKATFFVLGCKAQMAPEILKQLTESGHELGSHSQRHVHAIKAWPFRSLADVRQGFATLRSLGVEIRLFRPPYGKLNLLTWLATLSRGVRFAWWTVDSGDTFAVLPDPNSIVPAVIRDGGGVVLFHDFDRSVDREAYVLDLTQRLLNKAREHGWTICTQSELLT